MEATKFNEVRYLADASKLGYLIHYLMVKHGLLENKVHRKVSKFSGTTDDAPDGFYRIDPNGGIALRFVDQLPVAIVTPYGAIMLDIGRADTASEQQINNFCNELVPMLGLVFEDLQCYLKTAAVGKLPWRPHEKLPMPSRTFTTPKADISERVHMYKVLNVVNAKFMQHQYPQFIIPGTAKACFVNGKKYSLAQAVRLPGFVSNLEKELDEDRFSFSLTVPEYSYAK